MTNILDSFAWHSVAPLADTMPEKAVQQSIHDDFDRFWTSTNPKHYLLQSQAVKKATLSDKKILKRFGVKVTECDPLKLIRLIRTALRNFVMKCVKNCNLVLHPELGHKTLRLHFHGYYYGEPIHFARIVTWWTRNIGIITFKIVSGTPQNWFNYCEKAPISRNIVMIK